MRLRTTLLALASLILAGPAQAKGTTPAPAPAITPAPAQAKPPTVDLNKHPARQSAYWETHGLKNFPIENRIGPIPPEVLDYLHLDNQKQGFAERPVAAQPSPDFLRDMENAIREMPEPVRRIIARSLVGIYLVNDLGGSAYTDLVLQSGSRAWESFIILDIKAIDRKANEWATWKENTPFRSAGYRIAATLENDANDNRKNAIQYILLHEFGHVLAVYWGKAHQPWNLPQVVDPKQYLFSALSWELAPPAPAAKPTRSPPATTHGLASRFDGQFKLRPQIRYYRDEDSRLPASEMPAAYAGLEKTDFPTLYAATSPYDDFAESFASYVHSVLQKRPWEIAIYANDQKVKSVQLCWNEPRCAKKRQLLEKLFSGLKTE